MSRSFDLMLLNLVYLVLGVLLLPWVAWRRVAGRRPVLAPWTRFTGAVSRLPRDHSGVGPSTHKPTPRIWLHGVSVGEVQLLWLLWQEIAKQAQADGLSMECVVSSSTTTGLALATRRFGESRVFACPLDFTWAVNRVLDRMDPDMLVLGELELWPNLLFAASHRGVAIVVANARMSERSARGYGRIRPLVQGMLKKVSLVLARSQDDADRFTQLGATNVIVTGSMKFDGVHATRQSAEVARLRTLAGIETKADGTPESHTIFLAGSTQAPEEQLAIKTFLALTHDYPTLRLVLVPRHVERCGDIGGWLDRTGLRWQRRSRLEQEGADPQARVLLVDTTGELAWWWGTASIAFGGGSLDGRRGGQNMLEPAAYGAAICFGPFTRNFQAEVAVLQAANAAEIVTNGDDLLAFVARCLAEPQWAHGLGQRAAKAVAAHRGATADSAARILGQLPSGRTGYSSCRIPPTS